MIAMRMGLREANRSFSKAIKAVKAGKDVILTERGKPIAVIKPLEQEKNLDATLRRLEAEGLLRRGPKSGKPMPVWRSPGAYQRQADFSHDQRGA
jgi:prevent-host-death family protein